jgi:hypothetical protein
MKRNSYKLRDGAIAHDFRPSKTGWGWNALCWKQTDTALEMQGIGKGLKEGDFVCVKDGEDDVLMQIEEIAYDSNPPDMFVAIFTNAYGLEDGFDKLIEEEGGENIGLKSLSLINTNQQ